MGGLPTSQTADRRRAKAFAAAAKEAQASATPVEARRSDVRGRRGEGDPADQPLRLRHQLAEGRRAAARRCAAWAATARPATTGRTTRPTRAATTSTRATSGRAPCSATRTAACPGAQFIDFAQENKTLGAETLATIPIVDYVAADKNKKVVEADKAPSARWVKSIAKKPGALSLTPESRRQDRLPGRVRQPAGQQAGQGRRRRHQVLLARQRAGAVAEHAPAHPPRAHRATTRW